MSILNKNIMYNGLVLMKRLIFVLFILFIIIFNIYAKNLTPSDDMFNSMMLGTIEEDISINTGNELMSFTNFSKSFCDVITDKRANAKKLELLGNTIQFWQETLANNLSLEELHSKYSTITSTLSSMSMLLIWRVTIKEKQLKTPEQQRSLFDYAYNKFIPSFGIYKNDGWKTDFNFYVINMSLYTCKWYSEQSNDFNYPDFRIWKIGDY